MKRSLFGFGIFFIIVFSLSFFLGKSAVVVVNKFKYLRQSELRQAYAERFELEPVQVFTAFQSGGQFSLQYMNKSYKNIEILDVFVDGVSVKPASEITVIPSVDLDDPYYFVEVRYTVPGEFSGDILTPELIRVDSRLEDTSIIHSQFANPWPFFDADFLSEDFLTQPDNFRDFSFFEIHDKQINILPGDWVVKTPVKIPEGYQVVAGPGTSINLMNEAFILSYSPIRMTGSESKPVRIFSSDGKGQGLVVIKAKAKSKFTYVEFNGLGQVKQGLWSQTAALTFYESDVDFSHCMFRDNHGGDDMLNMFRTASFLIKDSLFEFIESDAVDSDFSDGTVKNTVFRNVGNDGVDVSGSHVVMQDVLLENIGDKALSAGEKSEMTLKNVEIKHSEIGITSKDLSDVNGENIDIKHTRLGVAVFQKKEEYGSASAVLNASLKHVDTRYLLEKGSTLTLNGKLVKTFKKKVKNKLYGNDFGKASR